MRSQKAVSHFATGRFQASRHTCLDKLQADYMEQFQGIVKNEFVDKGADGESDHRIAAEVEPQLI